MKRVMVESPYAGNINLNLKYLIACINDSLHRGEAPFASHGFYTQKGILDDNKISERVLGINAGFAWGEVADLITFYTDLGMSDGMQSAKTYYETLGIETEERKIDIIKLISIIESEK